MRNLPCAIWLVGSSFSTSYSEYVNQVLLGRTYSDDVLVMSSLVCLFFWIVIGVALYER